MNKDKIKEILHHAKHILNTKLGKFTHKKQSDDWYFYGLAFIREDIGYMFGFNIGLFNNDSQEGYTDLGMNVLVRLNGEAENDRHELLAFFRKYLKEWQTREEMIYEYPERGDKGINLARYAKVDSFEDIEQIIAYFNECANQLQGVYSKILERHDNLFLDIVRATPPWKTGITEIARDFLGEI